MKPPVLTLQTVYFHESDREAARGLGLDLYHHLTRPADEPLAYGAGIPVRVAVRADKVELDTASTTMLIPVVGKQAFLLKKAEVIAKIQEWKAELGDDHVMVTPVSHNWGTGGGPLGTPLLTLLAPPDQGQRDEKEEDKAAAKVQQDQAHRRTRDEIILAVTRLWDSDGKSVNLFISHAKADLTPTGRAAEAIHHFAATDGTGSAFFDENDLKPGESLECQLETAVSKGMFIAVRGDEYASRVWCQRELLLAKLNELPTLTVEVLRVGETRSSPYGGNGPSMLWSKDPAPVVSRAMIEWLRAEYFRREAARIIEAAGLPDDVRVLARPPELLDLAQGPLHPGGAQLVLHPDPELSVLERQVLKSARPRLRLATPTTAFRRLLSRPDGAADVSSPLEGMQVAMSLSESPDADGPEGFTADHVMDATLQAARTLISSGAAVAYGGDFRKGGFTVWLAQLIQTYNQTSTKAARLLHSYLAATIDLEDAPDDLPLEVYHLEDSEEFKKEAMLPSPMTPGAPPEPLYFSDMRRVMENHVAARVILGGKANPRTEGNDKGYGGPYPGVVEEAWRALDAKHPLYVLGGFGGAAGMVADLLEHGEIPEKLQLKTWSGSVSFTASTKAVLDNPWRAKLGLPDDMEAMATAIVKLGRAHLKSDKTAIRWNGLSCGENLLLFRSRDPVLLAALVSKGLLNLARRECSDQLQIELVYDTVTAASKLDAVAVAALDGVPLGGAGAALDRATGGLAAAARARGKTLVSLTDSMIDAEWLMLASLGKLEDQVDVSERIEQAACETAAQAERHGFKRVGIVTFGGSMLDDTEAVAQAMIRGFHSLSGKRAALTWYETDASRFESLQEILSSDERIKLTTRRALAPPPPPAGPGEPMILDIRRGKEDLTVTALPPAGVAVVSMQKVAFAAGKMDEFSRGEGGQDDAATPGHQELERRAAELGDILFGPQRDAMLALCRSLRVMLIHDTPASKVPFEMLFPPPAVIDGLSGSISRRLAVPGLSFERQFARPPTTGPLQVLLVVNPTRDLPGTVTEATALIGRLESLEKKGEVNLTVLRGGGEKGNEPTPERVAAELAKADVFHYCGHAFFDGPGPGKSGLLLSGRRKFTSKDLCDIPTLPRMAFVNACQAGRVRGAVESKAAAFAEFFLRSGIEAYLGTYWEVGDQAASIFASSVYEKLAAGETLEASVLAGRSALYHRDHPEPDWANYMLFGGGSFRLSVKK